MHEKTKSKRGFTLAELLIVVAIIAVLVAIAIPVFTTSLNKSKAATWEANARSVHADGVVQYLTAAQQPNGKYALSSRIARLLYTWEYDTDDNFATVTISGDGFDSSIAEEYCANWDDASGGILFSVSGGEISSSDSTPSTPPVGPVSTTHIVRFYANGTLISTQEINHGEPASEPTAPELPGYIFNGWDKSFNSVTGALEVTANYIPSPGPEPPGTGVLPGVPGITTP